jgi:hypothetical protein
MRWDSSPAQPPSPKASLGEIAVMIAMRTIPIDRDIITAVDRLSSIGPGPRLAASGEAS